MKGADGTRASGLVTDEQNKPPRVCSNCIWIGMGTCGNELITGDPENAHLLDKDGRVKVEPNWCSNGFQSQKNIAIYAVRHGETAGNKNNQFRGWLDIPLNAKGKKEAQGAREYLADKGIKRVFCSDLGRAIETAKIVLPSIKAERDPMMRPWDVGVFSGKDREETQEDFNHYIDNPEVRIPDGESLKEFAARMNKVFKRYLKEGKEYGPVLLVWHSSNCLQLEKQVEGKDELGRPEDVDRVLPGGIMCVLDEGDKLKVEVIFGASPERDADYGS